LKYAISNGFGFLEMSLSLEALWKGLVLIGKCIWRVIAEINLAV
jgi:hypothetical protein